MERLNGPQCETGSPGRGARRRGLHKDLGFGGEGGLEVDHFGDDAAGAPQVDGPVVRRIPQNELRRPVPRRDHARGKLLLAAAAAATSGRRRGRADGARHAEVGELESSAGAVEEEVVGFDVTV